VAVGKGSHKQQLIRMGETKKGEGGGGFVKITDAVAEGRRAESHTFLSHKEGSATWE